MENIDMRLGKTIHPADGLTKEEGIIWALSLGGLLWLMSPALFSSQSTFKHDTVFYGYPVYQFWAESLLEGRWPFWNPFSHGGEPFYPVPMMVRLLDPHSLVVLIMGSRLTDDLVTLFHWDLLTRGLIIGVGTYLLLRRWAEHHITRLLLIPVMLLSSYQLVSYRQIGISSQFIWVPWILLTLCQILESSDYRWRRWMLLGIFVGLNWQSYFFVGTWIAIPMFLAGIGLFTPQYLRTAWSAPWLVPKVLTAVTVAGLLCAPSFVVFSEQGRWVFPSRMVDKEHSASDGRSGALTYEVKGTVPDDSIVMSYSLVEETGTFSTPLDFVQLLIPFGSGWVGNKWPWGSVSEATMYFGALVYVVALFGIVAGRHHLKRAWFMMLVIFGVLMLGPAGGLHRLLFPVYPPLWFLRHTHFLVLFFSISLLYFFVIGCNGLFADARALSLPERVCNVGRYVELVCGLIMIHWLWVGVLLLALGFTLNKHNIDAWRSLMPFGIARLLGTGAAIHSLQAVLIGIGLLASVRAMQLPWRDWLHRFLQREGLAFIICCTLVLSGVIICSVTPSWYLGPLILPGIPLLWRLRKTVGVQRTYGLLLTSHILVLLLRGRSVWFHLPLLLITGGVPLFLLVARHQIQWLTIERLMAVFLVWLTGDLALYASSAVSSMLVPRPDKLLEVSARPMSVSTPIPREVFPPCQWFAASSSCLRRSVYAQQIKYSELLFRKPVVFTPIWLDGDRESGVALDSIETQIQEGLRRRRVTSFLMSKHYFAIINKGLGVEPMRSLFAVHQAPLQFKTKAIVLDDSAALRLLSPHPTGPNSLDLDHDVIIAAPGGEMSLGAYATVAESLDEEAFVRLRIPQQADEPSVDGGSQSNPAMLSPTKYGYNFLSISTRTVRDGLLYWADGYDPHWRASIDGIEVPVLRANINFKAVWLPKGNHRIDFVYDPVLFRRALGVFYGTALIVCIILSGCAVIDSVSRLRNRSRKAFMQPEDNCPT